MAGGKLTPRQKMINMMYLVLTALLAMNVSAEILNAFSTVNNSILKSNTMIDTKNNALVKALEKEKESDPAKAAKLLEIAGDVRSKSSTLIAYIEGLKSELDKQSDKDDDLDVASRVIVDGGKGKELYSKLQKYQSEVDAAMGEYKVPLSLDLAIPKTQNKENASSWDKAYFYMVPKIAAKTILSKFQNDIKSSEAVMMEELAKQAVTVDIKLDQFKPLVSAKSSYILLGDKYEATIGVGAFSSQIEPEITVNGSRLNVEPGTGMAKYSVQPGSAGTNTLNVRVGLKKRDGTMEYYDDKLEYEVGVPAGAAVMPDKMNVIYIGVDNPMTISSGAGAEKTVVTASGASINKGTGPGKYVARATTVGQATINVAVTGGKSNAFPFRVKRIPDPIPTLGGKLRGGNAPAGTIKAQSGIVPILENFDFEARFNVQSFTMIYSSKGEIFKAEASGPLFNDQMNNFLTRCRPKDIIFIDDIKVVGPDGTPRKLGQIAFTII